MKFKTNFKTQNQLFFFQKKTDNIYETNILSYIQLHKIIN